MNLPRAGQSQPKGRIRPAGRKMPRSVLMACPIHWAPHRAQGLMVLDDETQCWSTQLLSASHPGSTAGWDNNKHLPASSVCD